MPKSLKSQQGMPKKYIPMADRPCKYPPCSGPKLVQVFAGEDYCCELCRKALAGDISEDEWRLRKMTSKLTHTGVIDRRVELPPTPIIVQS